MHTVAFTFHILIDCQEHKDHICVLDLEALYKCDTLTQ